MADGGFGAIRNLVKYSAALLGVTPEHTAHPTDDLKVVIRRGRQNIQGTSDKYTDTLERENFRLRTENSRLRHENKPVKSSNDGLLSKSLQLESTNHHLSALVETQRDELAARSEKALSRWFAWGKPKGPGDQPSVH